MRQAPIDPRRYPQAYMLRARRERAEAEIRSPVEVALSYCQARLRAAQNALVTLERILGSKVAERVMEKIAVSFSARVRRCIAKAVSKARRAHGLRRIPLAIRVRGRDLVWLDPGSIERRVLDEWHLSAGRNLWVRADIDSAVAFHEGRVTVLKVEVPSFGYAQHLWPERIGIREQYIGGETAI